MFWLLIKTARGNGDSPAAAKHHLKRKPRTAFPGITGHAVKLEVRREHLWQVLTGRRQSRRLLARYKDLLIAEGREVPQSLRERAA